MIGGADQSGFDGDAASHQLMKSEVADFMFTQNHQGVETIAGTGVLLAENHASVVPDSEEKHSDTTQQNIQMLKDQLEKPEAIECAPQSNRVHYG